MAESVPSAPPPPTDGPRPRWLDPRPPSSGASPDLPETTTYRLKRALLGPPLVSEQLHSERLGKPVALTVLSSDVMPSSAYDTESVAAILQGRLMRPLQ